jgi:polysaccharide export outer membrane protein
MNNNFSVKHTIYFLALILFLGSCGSSKKITYFQPLPDTTVPTQFNTAIPQEAVIVPDDMLAIIVSALDPAAAAPFAISSSTGNESGSMGYLVDKNGNIEFPILGTLHVSGMTKSQAVEFIKGKLLPYLKEPIVTIRFMNFRVSVLGEVANPGAFAISNERVNLLEVLAMAGDLTIQGKRQNVLVIRENGNGSKSSLRVDLTDNKLFQSPFFYVQQNDIVYVEPNKTKIMSASYARQNLPFFISTISGLASVTAVVIALTR